MGFINFYWNFAKMVQYYSSYSDLKNSQYLEWNWDIRIPLSRDDSFSRSMLLNSSNF